MAARFAHSAFGLAMLATLGLILLAPDAFGKDGSPSRDVGLDAAPTSAHELRLAFHRRARPRSSCSLTARAGGQREALPSIKADRRGRAAWRWTVTSGAPSGRWTFTSRCARHARRGSVRRLTSFVLVPAGNGPRTLVAPGTVTLVHGRWDARFGRQAPRGRGAAPGNPFARFEGWCTFGAWEQAQWLGRAVTGNAKEWYSQARRAGLPTGSTPVVGAVFVQTAGRYGHVGVVTRVIDASSFETIEMNGGRQVPGREWGVTTEFGKYRAHIRYTSGTMRFIYRSGTQPPVTPPPPQPPVTDPPKPPPSEITLTVYNKVTNGGAAMREDTPAYLSTLPRNFCKRDGCAIAATDRNTGGTYAPAVCQTSATRTTNGNDGNSNDDANPGLFTSTRWYGIRLGGGGLGYISEVWIDPSQRGGLGLPSC